VAGSWRRLHSEGLHNLYTSTNIIRVTKSKMRWARHIAQMEEMKKVYKILVRKSKGKPRCIWEDNIKLDLREMVCEGMDWILLAQDRDQWLALVNMLMNLRNPKR
jgi:hypothetical protein